jgi:hypothetical protein
MLPKKVSDRLIKELPTFQKVLQSAKDRDINESDTVVIVSDMLATVFGFNKYSEITTEFCIRGTYCDLAVKIEDSVQYLVEAKAIGLGLKDNHLRQAVSYGANKGIPWIVLTNGINWEIYRIRFEQPIQTDLVCTIDFLTINPKKSEDQEKLFLLCREGMSKAAMAQFAERVQSVNRFVIAALMQTEPVITLVKKELKKLVPGLKVENNEIEAILKSDVLKREVIDGDEPSKAIAKIKRANKATAKIKPVPKEQTA